MNFPVESKGLKALPIGAQKVLAIYVLRRPDPLIEDLDSIPFPARHLVPMEQVYGL